MLEKIFFDLVDDAMSVETHDQGDQLLQKIKEMYGLSHVAYLGVNIPLPSHEKYFIQNTYSDEWAQHYAVQEFIKIDPIIHGALTNLLPQQWSEVPQKSSVVQKLFTDARDHGLGKAGFTFPVRGKAGDIGIFTINSDLKKKEWDHLRKVCMRDFLTLASYFHNGVLKAAGVRIKDKGENLSSRELEALKWASSGKTAWETGEILNVTERTIKFHLSNARTKLNCLTTTQAVARGISLGLISVY